MKRIITAIISLALASTAAAASLTEKIDRTFDVKPGANVSVSNTNGRVTVGSWDQPRVRVVAIKEVEGPKDELKKLMTDLKVELVSRDGGLTVNTHYPKQEHGIVSIFDALTGNDVNFEVTYEITVPRQMNVAVENTNGTLELSNVSGSINVATTNGRIALSNCAGTVNAETTNGSIEAQLVRLDRKAMRFETTNGRISVSLPANAAVNLDASTTNGSIDSALPVAMTSTSKNSLRGAINGGGTPLTLRTTNGGITVKKSS